MKTVFLVLEAQVAYLPKNVIILLEMLRKAQQIK